MLIAIVQYFRKISDAKAIFLLADVNFIMQMSSW